LKLYRLHIIIFTLFLITNYQIVSSTTVLQKPDQIRQFDNDFKDQYSGRKFNYEGKEIVTESQSGSGKYEDYKNGKPNLKEKNNFDSFSINLGPLNWLFYGVLASAVLYLVYILFNEGGAGLFSSNKNRKINNYDEITAENIEITDIHTLIKNAENTNDYRLAIRYYYLLVLKNLSLKNYIKFEDDKTNTEYLNEISSKPFSSKFEYSSYLYNYIWYGEFSLNFEQYNKAKSNFETLLNQVK